MTILLCPTDVADNYVGTPMVERVMTIEPATVPHVRDVQCPAAPDGGGCTCGPERCLGNYGWDGMCPDLVMHPSVVFRVFVDGQQVAESPIMRIAFEPWRFNVPIPKNSKRISLVATDAGDGHYMDLANWGNAGFVLKKQ